MVGRQIFCEAGTDYARPPQIPSRLMRMKTVRMLRPSASAEKKPTADSKIKASNTSACTIAGRGNRRDGRGGTPIEIEDRDKKTVVWYTNLRSCLSNW